MKKQKTNKLFYKKYPYKIKCHIKGAWLLRNNVIEETIRYCNSQSAPSWKWANVYTNHNVDVPEVADFIEKIKPYFDLVKLRIEHNFLDIYTEDRQIYDTLSNSLSKWVQYVWEPENQKYLNFLLSSNSVKILCDEYPHKKYRYKVYIKNKLNPETKKNFSSWASNYPEKIITTGESTAWLDNVLMYTWNPCLYIEDQATLSMVCLFLGNNVQRVEEYITKVSINTTL